MANFMAPPISGLGLEQAAESLLKWYYPDNLSGPTYLDVLQLLERMEDGPERVVFGTKNLDSGIAAYTDPERREIVVDHGSVFVPAQRGDGFARQTCAHEIGHIRHIPVVKMMITHYSGPQLQRAINVDVPVFRDPEWQAHHLGQALLMPRLMFREVYVRGGLIAVQRQFGVSGSNAASRLKALRRQHVIPL